MLTRFTAEPLRDNLQRFQHRRARLSSLDSSQLLTVCAGARSKQGRVLRIKIQDKTREVEKCYKAFQKKQSTPAGEHFLTVYLSASR